MPQFRLLANSSKTKPSCHLSNGKESLHGLDVSQFGSHLVLDPVQTHFWSRKPRTPPLRTTVTDVAATCTKIYMRHTGQCPSSSACGSSHTHTAARFSPHSSVRQWLQTVDPQTPPPPSLDIPASQPLSIQSGVPSSMPLGFSASQMALQHARNRSSHPSRSSRRTSSSLMNAAIQSMTNLSVTISTNMTTLADGWRAHAANRIRMQRQEVAELRQEAAIREERSRADALAREELRMRSQSETEKANLTKRGHRLKYKQNISSLKFRLLMSYSSRNLRQIPRSR